MHYSTAVVGTAKTNDGIFECNHTYTLYCKNCSTINFQSQAKYLISLAIPMHIHSYQMLP